MSETMRFGFVARCFVLALVTGGCGASTASRPDAGSGGQGGGGQGGQSDAAPNQAVCAQALGTDCSSSPLHVPTGFCPLDAAIASACEPCGPNGQGCTLKGALVRGAKYTYVELMNVDVAGVFVYDKAGVLVAKLWWSANVATDNGWACNAGPADFDMSEAMSLLPVIGPGELSCPAAAAAAR